MILGKTFKIDAAHFLPNHEGKCKNTHGHTWTVTVEVSGPLQKEGPACGMVMDLKDLSEIVHLVLDRLDHKLINSIVENPTCENLAFWLQEQIQNGLPRGVDVNMVTVQEGDGGYARC